MDGWVFFAFTAALNPTLLGATTVMLLLDHPKRLLLGYLFGALLTSLTLGLVIVFALDGSSGGTSTAQNTLSPAMDLTLGGILLVVAFVIRPGSERWADDRRAERRRRREEAKRTKGPPRWQRALSEGSARTTFVVGALLTLPGASYLIGLSRIAETDASTAAMVAMILAFNAIMLILLEVPLIAYTLAPEWTPRAVDCFKAWFNANSRLLGFRLAAGIGVLLVAKGAIELL
ncbi:MAG TPA: GAP family protein [Solirubrobacterales bacterium]|nr:GAP family protein [Solirubrobacterales bacterium]